MAANPQFELWISVIDVSTGSGIASYFDLTATSRVTWCGYRGTVVCTFGFDGALD